MKISFAALALLGLVEARHMQQQGVTFLQSELENPDAARATFEAARNAAAATVANQKAFEAASNASVEAAQVKYAAATYAKKKGVRDARVRQTQGEAKVSRDSKGWRLVWPVGSLAETESPEQSYNAKAVSLKAAQAATSRQRKEEADSNADVAQKHAEGAANAKELQDSVRAARDNQINGGVQAARDSLGWPKGPRPNYNFQTQQPSMRAQLEYPDIPYSTVVENGQINGIQEFLAPDYDNKMRFAQRQGQDSISEGGSEAHVYHFTKDNIDISNNDQHALGMESANLRQDTIGPDGFNEKVYHFVKPNIVFQNNDKNYDEAYLGAHDDNMHQDTIGAGGYNEKVYHFVKPNIVYQSNDKNYDKAYLGEQDDNMHQDTIGAGGYNEKVYHFVKPNIVYQSNDKNYDKAYLGEQDDNMHQDTIGAGGYNEKVYHFVKPNIVYQSNDKNYDKAYLGTTDDINEEGQDVHVAQFTAQNTAYNTDEEVAFVETGEQFLGNPERVQVLDPIAYQTKANSNTLGDISVKRTTFYDKQNSLWRGNFDMM